MLGWLERGRPRAGRAIMKRKIRKYFKFPRSSLCLGPSLAFYPEVTSLPA
jgi:hypothetical protein